jgi:F0F1-type ATP synthase assembly protein I
VGKVAGGPKDRQENQTPILRRAGLYLGVAFELPGTILGGLVVGYFADDYFGTSPWLLISCTAVAFIGAFIRLLQWVRVFTRQRDGSSRQKNDFPH